MAFGLKRRSVSSLPPSTRSLPFDFSFVLLFLFLLLRTLVLILACRSIQLTPRTCQSTDVIETNVVFNNRHLPFFPLQSIAMHPKTKDLFCHLFIHRFWLWIPTWFSISNMVTFYSRFLSPFNDLESLIIADWNVLGTRHWSMKEEDDVANDGRSLSDVHVGCTSFLRRRWVKWLNRFEMMLRRPWQKSI